MKGVADRRFLIGKTTFVKPYEEAPDMASAVKAPPISDAEGLDRAYQQGDTYRRGDTLYIAGSHTAQDWYDDVTKVPVWGDLRESERYIAAKKAFDVGPPITKVVGHSLGGAVALELMNQAKGTEHPLESTTYGAPVTSISGGNRYRNYGDPVSMFDRGANMKWHPDPSSSGSLTHDYHDFNNVTATSGDYGYVTPTGEVALTE